MLEKEIQDFIKLNEKRLIEHLLTYIQNLPEFKTTFLRESTSEKKEKKDFLQEEEISYPELRIVKNKEMGIEEILDTLADEELEIEEDFEPSTVIKLLDKIILSAHSQKVRSIHFHPKKKFLSVLYKQNGVLVKISDIPKTISNAIIARLKIIGDLDITEKRQPQQGKATLIREGKKIFLTISTLPSFYGERIIVKLQVEEYTRKEIDNLGFSQKAYFELVRLIKKPGVLLISGPSKSGKRLLTRAILSYLSKEQKNIITINLNIDTISDEITHVESINSYDINHAIAIKNAIVHEADTIATRLTSLESAQKLMNAAFYGITIVATMHTYGCTNTLIRLLDMGLSNILIASHLKGIIYTRLLRKICPHCKNSYKPSTNEQILFTAIFQDVSPAIFYKGNGCEYCVNTGYLDQISVYEFFIPDENFLSFLLKTPDRKEIMRYVEKQRIVNMKEEMKRKILEEKTTLEECIQVLNE